MNRFPFPADLPPIELMMYITTGEVHILYIKYKFYLLILDLHSLLDWKMSPV